MKNKEDDIEDLFRNHFDNDEVDVSPKVWENIKKTLPAETDSLGYLFSQNSLLWTFSGLLMTTLVVGTLLYQKINGDNDTREKTGTLSVLQAAKKDSGVVYTGKDLAHAIVSAEADSNLSLQHSASDANTSNQRTIETDKQSGQAFNAFSTDIKKSTSHRKASSTQAFLKNTDKIKSSDKTNLSILKKNKKQASSNRSAAKETKNSSHKEKTSTRKKTTAGPNKKSVSSYHSLNTSNSSDRGQNKELNGTEKSLIQNQKEEKYILDRSASSKQPDKLNHRSSAKKDLSAATSDANIIRSVNSHLADSTAIKKEDNKTLSNSDFLTTETSSANSIHADSLQALTNHTEKKSIDSVSNQASLTKEKNTASTFNDSLATVTALDKNSSADSSLLALKDSTSKTTLDSVLTKVTGKKEKRDTSYVKHWSFDIIGSGLFTGGSLKSNDASYQSSVDNKKQAQKNLPGYALGVMINYKLNNKFRISTGVLYTAYSTTSYHFQYNLQKQDSVYVDSTWQHKTVDSINTNKTMKDSYSFLSIPLQLSYTFLTKGKLQLAAIVGIRGNLLSKGKTYLVNEKGTDLMELNGGFRSFYFSYVASLEMQYQLNSHMALLAQPVFNYAANSIYTTSSPISQKPYNLGLTIGLRFTF